MSRFRKLLAGVGALALIGGLAACSTGGAEPAASGEATSSGPVRIGVVGASDPYWATYTQAAKDAGIDVKIVDFTDYNQPNPALSADELDLNQFQHILYLAQYNVDNNDTLVPIGSTAIYPLGLYSKKVTSVADVPQGGKVAIPNDPTNQARALLVLQSAGLVKLKDGGTAFSTPDDIDTAASKVQVQSLDASLIATSLPDFDAGILNNDYLDDAGVQASDAIAQDDPKDPAALAYVNIFVAKADRANDPTLLKLVEIYQNTQSVQDGVLENSGGTAVLLQTPAADLQAQLKKVEEDYRNK